MVISYKNKSDVFNIFTEFHIKAESQFSLKLCAFQSDWGGEFQSLNKYMKDHGIHHQVSCPYTPEQNDTFERKLRHIIETSLAIRKQASLLTTFCDEAITTASLTEQLYMSQPPGFINPQFPNFVSNLKKSFMV